MTKKTIFILAIAIFAITSQSRAESDKKFTAKDVKQFVTNNTFVFMDQDTVSAIYALTALNGGDTSPVVEYFEFQLDILVCEGWEIKDHLNEPSAKRAMNLLHQIKAYRLEHPRNVSTPLSKEQIKALFPGAENTGIDYTAQAKVILAELE